MAYRIVHCLRAPVGGLFRHVRDLAREQTARGHNVGVVCDSTAADELTNKRLDALRQHLDLGLERVPMSRSVGLEDARAYRGVRRFLQKADATIVHGHGAKGGAYARLAARGIRKRGRSIACFYTPHGGSLHYHPSTLKGRAYMAAERTLARFTDGIIFESSYSAEKYGAQVGAPKCETRVIPNGLLPSEFTAYAPVANAATFLFVGELRKLKGVDVMLRALASVRRDHDCNAVIVGSGPEQAEFQSLTTDLDLDQYVAFPGAMPASDAFKLGRSLIMPSRAESFPYIVLEAAAAGMPLYATNVGGIPEIVAGTQTQLLPPDDVDALAKAMRDFLLDPVGALDVAEHLKARVASAFTVSTMADAIDSFYATNSAS